MCWRCALHVPAVEGTLDGGQRHESYEFYFLETLRAQNESLQCSRVPMAVTRVNEAILGTAARLNRSLLSVAWHSSHFSRSVTCLVRLLLLASFLLLATFALVTYPLLGSGQVPTLLWGGSSTNWPKDAFPQNSVVGFQSEGIRHNESVMARFNESFLAFAAIDQTDESEKRKIRMILDGKVDEMRYLRNKWSYQRRMDHYVDLDRSRPKMRPRYESWLLQLQSPRFAECWTRFRQMLQGWSRYRYYDPNVMLDLVQIVKKPLDQFNAENSRVAVEEGRRYRTCAVVGNSGILLNRSFGHFIDSHDTVMRLNNARVDGFEEFVGSKTTLSFVNSNIYHGCSKRPKCFCHPYGEVPMIMYLCQVQHMMDLAFCGPNHRAPVLVTDPRLDNLCSRLVKWYSVTRFVETTDNPVRSWEEHHDAGDFHYSSGFQAIVLALGICEKVDIFGFGKSPQAKHHYHTNQKGELDLHDYAAEYLFYDDLVNNRTSSIPFLNEASGFNFPTVQIFR